MSSLLFIAPADLGETVLATGALDYAITRMKAQSVTVVCEPTALNLFLATPRLNGLYERRGGLGAALALSWRVAQRSFDVALDFAPAPAVYAWRAKRRVRPPPARRLQHLAETYSEAVNADHTIAPKLWLYDHARASAAKVAPGGGALLVLAPGGASGSKRWSPERFASVARRLVDGPLSGARIVVLSAARRDVEIARAITNSLDADGVTVSPGGDDLALMGSAALLERATLVIGNDNVLAHIAAAMGAPTLTLFGPTDERVRAPYGPRTRTLRGRSFEEIAAPSGLDARAAMEDVSVDAVEVAALDLLHAGGLR